MNLPAFTTIPYQIGRNVMRILDSLVYPVNLSARMMSKDAEISCAHHLRSKTTAADRRPYVKVAITEKVSSTE
jgi:hypothetical protein